jgi:hypothetical protein
MLAFERTELSRSKARPLIQYIQTSNSIRQIAMFADDKWLMTELFVAIGRSPSIEELTLHADVPPTAFHDLMATTRSLKRLTLSVYQSSNGMAEAFSVNKTMQSVKIRRNGHGGVDHIGPVLKGISLSGTKVLQVLELNCAHWGTIQQWNSFCQMLCTVSSLRDLKLERMAFSREKMLVFVGCLGKPTNSDIQCAAIAKLSLWYCSSVDSQFIELLQRKTIHWNNWPSWSSPLLELSVLHDWDNSLNQIVSSLHGSLEKNEGNQQIPTIASQLTSLHITLFPDTLQHFVPHAKCTSLERLHLNSRVQTDCHDLPNVIPYMPALRALDITTDYDPHSISQILLGVVRQSGNLHATSICQEAYHGDKSLCLRPDIVRVMNAYCERNRQMDLSVPNGIVCWTLAESKGVSPLHKSHFDKALYPLLLAVARQVPLSHHCSWLSLLLRLGCDAG